MDNVRNGRLNYVSNIFLRSTSSQLNPPLPHTILFTIEKHNIQIPRVSAHKGRWNVHFLSIRPVLDQGNCELAQDNKNHLGYGFSQWETTLQCSGRRQAIIWNNAGILLIQSSGQTSVKYQSKWIYVHSQTCFWKCYLRNVGNFLLASMC